MTLLVHRPGNIVRSPLSHSPVSIHIALIPRGRSSELLCLVCFVNEQIKKGVNAKSSKTSALYSVHTPTFPLSTLLKLSNPLPPVPIHKPFPKLPTKIFLKIYDREFDNV